MFVASRVSHRSQTSTRKNQGWWWAVGCWCEGHGASDSSWLEATLPFVCWLWHFTRQGPSFFGNLSSRMSGCFRGVSAGQEWCHGGIACWSLLGKHVQRCMEAWFASRVMMVRSWRHLWIFCIWTFWFGDVEEGGDDLLYIANWMTICYRSHLLREPGKSIELMMMEHDGNIDCIIQPSPTWIRQIYRHHKFIWPGYRPFIARDTIQDRMDPNGDSHAKPANMMFV